MYSLCETGILRPRRILFLIYGVYCHGYSNQRSNPNHTPQTGCDSWYRSTAIIVTFLTTVLGRVLGFPNPGYESMLNPTIRVNSAFAMMATVMSIFHLWINV